jgi:hypothetical protein
MAKEKPDEVPPFALTGKHVTALERAIGEEGFGVLVDPATGDIKLEALTDQHIAALEKAVRAEGFIILYDVSTGKFKLARK